MSINRKASKKHCVFSLGKNVEYSRFNDYLQFYGDERILNRLLEGRRIKPCGKECREYGFMIAKSFDHASFVNFEHLMNDKEFLLEIAKITPNPTKCYNYFWLYVNSHLKQDQNFRLELLKAIYLNNEVYQLSDINLIVDFCGLKKENKKILKDDNFKFLMEEKLRNTCYEDCLNYNCSGDDKKELQNYKVNSNRVKQYCEKVKNGLKEIISTFESSKVQEVDIRDLIEAQFFDLD